MSTIVQVGNPILEKNSIPVKNPKSDGVKQLVNRLLEICIKNEKNAGGLAAPQIGKNYRIFVVRRTDLEEKYKRQKKELPKEKQWEVMINPRVIKIGKKQEAFWEGCLSVENGKVFGPVKRPSFIRVEYFDKLGGKTRLTATGFFAHEVQHELDHLNGILFIKYVKNPENLWKSKDLDEYLREHDEMPGIV